MLKKLRTILFTLSLLLFANISFALSSAYIPHVYLKGYAATDAIGQADILAPVFLPVDGNLFIYGQGRYGYSNNNFHSWQQQDFWTGSLGLGYRQIFNDTVLFGAYGLGEYSRSLHNRSFWLLSPGVEALSRTWDFRANGYFPVSKKDWTTEGWADEFSDFNHISFKGHAQYNYRYIYDEETGPGADVELGRKLFNINNILVKGYVDGYYFDMRHHKDIVGGGGRITVQPNTCLELGLNYSYDHYNHNTVLLSARVSLSDLFSHGNKVINDQDLQARLYYPLERNFGSFGSGSNVRIAGIADSERRVIHPVTPERDNIWFFDGTNMPLPDPSDGGDGTYEHPYAAVEFNQETVQHIQNYSEEHDVSQAFLYFNAGRYNTTTSVDGLYSQIELYENMSLWGRTGEENGFQDPALGDARKNIAIVGGLKLDSNTSLNDLWVHNDKTATSIFTSIGGVVLDNAQNVGIDNVEIGAGMDPANAVPRSSATVDTNAAYNIGISMSNNSQIALIKDSAIYGYSDAPEAAGANGIDAIGIELKNGGTITAIYGSIFSGVGSDGNDNVGGNGGKGGNGYGIKAADGGIAIGQIAGSKFLGNGGGGGLGGTITGSGNGRGIIGGGGAGQNGTHLGGNGGSGYGLFVNSANAITVGNIDNSLFYGNVNTGTVGTIGAASGINYGGLFGGGGANYGGDGGSGYGLYAKSTGGSVVIGNITNSSFYGNANLGNVGTIGAARGSNSAGIFDGGGYLSGGDGGSSYGLFASGSSTVSIGNINGSSFYGNVNRGDVTIIGSSTGATAGTYGNYGGIFGGGGSASSAGIGGSGYGLSVSSTSSSVTIGSISNSSFYGNANTGRVTTIGAGGLPTISPSSTTNYGGIFGGGGSGGRAGGSSYGLFIQAASGIEIENIANSFFLRQC